MRTIGRVLFLSIAVALGCNAILGIDDEPRPVAQADASGVESDADASAQTIEACSADRDCAALDPCLGARCDVVAHRCIYSTCEPVACSRGSCNQATRVCTTATNPYGIVSQTLALPGVAIGCSGSARDCFAAVYPYAFVGTPSGVLAASLADLSAIEAAAIPVDLPFSPTQIVASDDVVYFLGPVEDGKLAIASTRVPSDPRITRFSPDAAELSYPFARARLLPAPGGAVFVVFDDASLGFPAALLDRTLRGGAPILHVSARTSADAGPSPEPEAATGMYGALAFDDDAGPDHVGASSGGRLVVARSGSDPVFSLVAGAGTPHAALTQPAFGKGRQPSFLGPGAFVPGPDGIVWWASPWYESAPDTSDYRLYSMGFLLVGGASSPLRGQEQIWTAPIAAQAAAPADLPTPPPALPLMVDGETIFFVGPSSSKDPSGLEVFVLRRGTNGIEELPPKNPILQEPETDARQVAVAQTLGYGLLLRPSALGMKLTVLDRRCSPLP